MDRDPREVEMLAIVNMQPIPAEVIKGLQDLETSATTIKVDEAEEEDVILKPGTKIRPLVTIDDARKLAERLYGIVAKDISELISYDDRNFLIHADRFVCIVLNECRPGMIMLKLLIPSSIVFVMC